MLEGVYMNREILFKAKRKDNSEWVYGQLIYKNCLRDNGMVEHLYRDWTETYAYIYEDNCENNTEEYPTKFIEVIPQTVCRYTNLDDKNGKKIFENDIIRLDDKRRRLISRADAKSEEELCRKDCLVGFKDGSFMFGRNRYSIDDFDSYLWLTNNYCEIIGNKFDDGELIC